MSMSGVACEVTLIDIPGAKLSKPYNKHTCTISALRWWLLCKGDEAPTFWKKQQILVRFLMQHLMISLFFIYFFILLFFRVLLTEQEQAKIVDVDGSNTHRKYVCW